MESEMIDIATTSVLSGEHAETLATKWWAAEKFRQHGVPCREGAFMDAETEIIRTTIRKYSEARNLSQEEVEDLIFGTNRQEGFWAHIARAIPPRRVRSSVQELLELTAG
ncbi:hypothetical protein BJV78DRAFT_1284764 [Lactifluus subvellereus]|nr:hypothetical protein BJV78DRAFT_1284764 [Lactifluus subvellereus]